MEEVLRISNLTKHYGRIRAIHQLNLTIHTGEIWGILGPNGSGKTTTLALLLDIIRPDQGSFEWFGGKYGKNPRKQIGAILETPNFYPYLNALENLKIIQHIKQSYNDDLDYLLTTVNLIHRKNSKFLSYSLGMKQRLAIAATLIGDPQVLIFDEPTNGLDPMGIVEIRNTLIDIGKLGKTIIMASHILDEVEKVCNHVAILKKGQLIKTGQVGSILTDKFMIELGCKDLEKLHKILRDDKNVQSIIIKKEWLEVQLSQEVAGAYFNRLANNHDIALDHIRSIKPTLEQEFIALVNK